MWLVNQKSVICFMLKKECIGSRLLDNIKGLNNSGVEIIKISQLGQYRYLVYVSAYNTLRSTLKIQENKAILSIYTANFYLEQVFSIEIEKIVGINTSNQITWTVLCFEGSIGLSLLKYLKDGHQSYDFCDSFINN